MAYNLLRSMEIFGLDFDTIHNSKGQIKSEWIYEIINFPTNDPKIRRISALCTEKILRTEILHKIWVIFWKLVIS